MADETLCLLSASELAPLLRQREISPVEVVEAHLARIADVNPLLLAYLYVDGDRALAQARAAEIEIASGGYRGPLHGIPVAHKDIYHVQGLPTTAASRLMAGYVADEDATVVARLRQAGAICLGKLNTYEFASGSMEAFGSARNPWNTLLMPGGSSAGSGAALAAHLVTLASGTDTGGSIRHPAAFCGVVGLKPTYGRVSRAGILALSWSMDHAGPLARTVADTALFLHAIAGPDPRDPTAAQQPVPNYHAALGGGVHRVRIGVPRTFFFEQAEPEVADAVRAAIDELRRLGATVLAVDLPHARYAPAVSWAVAFSEAFAIHRATFLTRPRDYTPGFLHKISAAAFLTAEERVTAQRLRQVITAEFLAALDDVDVIATPTTPHVAYRLGGQYPRGDSSIFTRAASVAGLPALAVPCGFTSAGLPVSMQLIARPWAEATALCVGYAYEQATPWHTYRAPVAANEAVEAVPPAAAPAFGASPPPDDGPAVDAQWVLDVARLFGLTYVTPADAAPIAASVAPIKAYLAEARRCLDAAVEPPTRPAP
jgi:aspartyl-tRNA(Asn)/glutamyl-tRNA(Gln) amidotransferase subunit A